MPCCSQKQASWPSSKALSEFDNVDRNGVEKLAQECKVIFGSTNPRKLDPSFLRLGLLICNIRSSMHQANELLQYRTTVKKTFLVENYQLVFAVFSATHQRKFTIWCECQRVGISSKAMIALSSSCIIVAGESFCYRQ